MINERNLTLDHPIESSLSNTAAQTKNDNRSNSDITEVEVDEKANDSISPPIIDEEDVHDGGYGWFVVLGAFLVQVTSFGTCTSWGKKKN
ncbi:hypothetical protein G6F49_010206 [Rhizopus delemar]|nr:hypothetical protein G6F49_010206 [Rhizopus delemar]